MPIKPENRARYPANWSTEIVPRIRARDGHRCKFCGVRNHAWGFRQQGGDHAGEFIDGGMTADEAADALYQFLGEGSGNRLIRIVCTVAHLVDMNPEACDDGNLALLCQRCHNRHDQPHRQANAARTRDAKRLAALPADLFHRPTSEGEKINTGRDMPVMPLARIVE